MPDYDNITVDSSMTFRQKILALLESEPFSCRELSQLVQQSEKEVLAHLEHLRISLRPRNKLLVIDPAVCRNCDFVFASRTRLAKPGRCPKCKRSSIEPPLYSIREQR